MARLWADVLDVDADEIGRETGFFDLGGNSLLAARLFVVMRSLAAMPTISSAPGSACWKGETRPAGS